MIKKTHTYHMVGGKLRHRMFHGHIKAETANKHSFVAVSLVTLDATGQSTLDRRLLYPPFAF